MEHIRELEAFGVIDEIYAAIDTDDMAKIVKAATITLKKVHRIDNARKFCKSRKQSRIAREQADEFFDKNILFAAVFKSNMALTLAPSGSREMMLAYGLRSQIMFKLKNYTECLNDVKSCLSMNCPKSYVKQLKTMSDKCTEPLVLERFDEFDLSSFVSSFFRFDCVRNADVPCASANVTFTNHEGAKRVIVGKDIKVGAVVAIERVFESCVNVGFECLLMCYFCKKITPRLYPCDGCCNALFCSNECRDQCIDEYHRIECQIVDYIKIIYKEPHNVLMTRTAIKLSLKLGWDALIEASENIGASRMKTATIRQTYNSDDPLSILSYDDRRICFEGKIFEGSIICARVLHQLDKVPNYLPKEPLKRNAAKEALSRIMLRLYTTFTNTIPVKCVTSNISTACSRESLNSLTCIYYGWFSMSSKLKHSCEPNLTVVGLKDKIALVALRTINEGEELTISYIDHFYLDTTEKCTQTLHRRATKIYMKIGYICEDCRVCDGDWDATSKDILTVITRKQAILIAKAEADRATDGLLRYETIYKFLDAFPVRTFEHKQAFKIINRMLNLVQFGLAESVNILNE